ncbi:TetR/AcrR family transcriptional regulator [Nocardia sp. NPDC004123]
MTQAAARNVAGDRRPPSRGDQQRALIIDAVTDLLRTVSITDMSVLRIAKHAGVSRPAFYFYFESKYSVVAAALEQVWTEIDQETSELTSYDNQEPPADFTIRMIDGAVAVWRHNAHLLNACAQSRDTDAQLRAMWDAFIGNLEHKLVAFIQPQVDSHHMRPASADLPTLISVLVAMTVAVLREETAAADTAAAARTMAAVRQVWLTAVWGTGIR